MLSRSLKRLSNSRKVTLTLPVKWSSEDSNPDVFVLILESWVCYLFKNDKYSFKSTKKIKWCLPSIPRGGCHCLSPVSLPRDVCLCRYTRTLYVFVLFLPPSQLVFAVDLVLHLTGRLFLLGAYADVSLSLFFFKQMTSIPLYPWLMDSDVSLDITDSTGVSNLAHISFCTGFLSLRTVAVWGWILPCCGRGGLGFLGRLAASLSTVSAGCQEPRIPS